MNNKHCIKHNRIFYCTTVLLSHLHVSHKNLSSICLFLTELVKLKAQFQTQLQLFLCIYLEESQKFCKIIASSCMFPLRANSLKTQMLCRSLWHFLHQRWALYPTLSFQLKVSKTVERPFASSFGNFKFISQWKGGADFDELCFFQPLELELYHNVTFSFSNTDCF